MGDGQLEDELRKSFFFGGIWHKNSRNDKTPLTEIKGVRPMWWAILDEVRNLWFVREGWDEEAIGRLNGLSSWEQGLV